MESILDSFKSLTNKEKIDVLNLLIKEHPAHVSFAAMSETEKKMWAPHFGELAKEYFGVK